MTDRKSSITYDSLNKLLIRSVPELEAAYLKELEAWKGEVPGPHIIFADILTPYIAMLLESQETEDMPEKIFDFLEKLANAPSSDVCDVIALSVIDPLRNQCAKEKWVGLMGPKMLKMLDELERS